MSDRGWLSQETFLAELRLADGRPLPAMLRWVTVRSVKSRISGLDWVGRSGLPEGSGNATGLRRGVGSAVFGIRAGEGPLAWLFFLNFLILTTVHFAAKTVRQAAYIDALGAENLPWVYLAVAAISLPVLIVYSRAAARVRLPMMILAATLLHVFGPVSYTHLTLPTTPYV